MARKHTTQMAIRQVIYSDYKINILALIILSHAEC